MVTGAERRRAARLTVAQPWRGGELEQSRAHVLDLTASGARIAHREPLHAGGIGYVDLPPALGAVRLLGRVVWTRPHSTEQLLDGDRQALYESGVEFICLTPKQQATLAAAVATLQTAQAASDQDTR
jgi:hypothetical protein